MRAFPAVALLVFTALAFAAPPPAHGEIGTLDRVPGATLLLPYFEVDPDSSIGVTTLFTVRNASAGPVVAHVTLWTNLSLPVLDFDIYLTGYDSEAVNLYDLFALGNLPITAPDDAYSPRGPRSKPHNLFGGTCSNLPYTDHPVSPLLRQYMRESLTGQPVALFSGECRAAPTDRMVGYLTIDALNRCFLDFPGAPGYFGAGGTGIASDRNVLWGDWQIVNQAESVAQGEAMIALEASADDPATTTPGNRTFYGRLVGGSAADNREPLSPTWHASLDSSALAPAGDGETELLVWRDAGVITNPIGCGSLPAPYPLPTTNSTVFDPDGNGTPLPAGALPVTTQRLTNVPAGASLDLDLNAATGSVFDPLQQGYVTVLHRGSGLYSTGSAAVEGTRGLLGTDDAAPGASLLLPYFEVDPSDPTARPTTATVHNASEAPVLARVVLWTDLGVPTLDFDLLLPGYGSRAIDLGALFADGLLPASGPSDLPGCAGRLPPGPLSPELLDGLREAHRGAPSSLFEGLCAGADHLDRRARGYLTVDVVTACSDALPGAPGAFDVLGFDNVLWGESVTADPFTSAARAEPLVHLQASATDPATAAGQQTFYGRYTGATAADHREALANHWGIPAWQGGAIFDLPEYEIWRDPGVAQAPFDCAAVPSPFPLGQGVSLRFDNHGFDTAVPGAVGGLATQRTFIDQPPAGGVFDWFFLDLDTATGSPFGTTLQSHVTTITRTPGRFVSSTSGVRLPVVFGTAVSAVATDPQAAERGSGSPPLPDPGEILLGRSGPLDQPLDVLVSISGTATQGTDYQLFIGNVGPLPATGGTLSLTFPAGESTLAVGVVPTLDTVSDDGETVILTVQPGLGYALDPSSTATVTIAERPPTPVGPAVSPVEIPTLAPWGLALLALALLGAGLATAGRWRAGSGSERQGSRSEGSGA